MEIQGIHLPSACENIYFREKLEKLSIHCYPLQHEYK